MLAPGIIETARGGQWGQFAFFLLCAALITFAVMLMLGMVRGR
jgi:hypothetical protein